MPGHTLCLFIVALRCLEKLVLKSFPKSSAALLKENSTMADPLGKLCNLSELLHYKAPAHFVAWKWKVWSPIGCLNFLSKIFFLIKWTDLRLFYFRVTTCFNIFPSRCFELILLPRGLTIFSFEVNRIYLQSEWSHCNLQ